VCPGHLEYPPRAADSLDPQPWAEGSARSQIRDEVVHRTLSETINEIYAMD
jgi:hypothetical protein